MATEATLPDFPLFEVDDAEVAFGADRHRYYGSQSWDKGKLDTRDVLPQLRAEEKIVSALFFSGGKLSDHGREWRADVDPKKAMRAFRALLGSWGVSHEQKTATAALALHHWTQPIAKAEAA